jgi:hypothetical protein
MQNSASNARILEKLPTQIKCLSEAGHFHIPFHETLRELVSVAAQDLSAGNVETSCK